MKLPLLVALGLGGWAGAPAHAQLAPAKPAATVAPAPAAAAVLPEPVAASQRRAVAKYPELGQPGSPLHARFLARYRTLQIEQSPRLGQANWPESIAEELAAPAAVNLLAPSAAAPAPAPNVTAPVTSPNPVPSLASPRPVAPAAGAAAVTATAVAVAASPTGDPGQVWVKGYTRADGTQVEGYWRKR